MADVVRRRLRRAMNNADYRIDFHARVLLRLLISCALTSSLSAGSPSALISESVVPDVIPEVPREVVTVQYPSGVTVHFGNKLTPTNVQSQPQVSWNANDAELYTLVMTDPDAPSRQNPNFREFRHWLVVNIPGKNVSRGEHFTEYIGSGPPEGTGFHRYVFLVYKQKGRINGGPKVTKNSALTRSGWSVNKFSEENGLKLVAANFFQAEYDDYVPILNRQLSGH